MTFVRFFDAKVYDMLELYVNAETLRTLNQFKNTKCAVGLKPLLAFSGTLFDSPIANAYTAAKSIFIDFFRGQEVGTVDVEGLQYLIHFAAVEEEDGQPTPEINMRVYLVKTKKSGQKVPRVELEEMGPRIDFRIGRRRDPDDAVRKEAYKRPEHAKVYLAYNRGNYLIDEANSQQAKSRKNIETDLMGDKMGRIHVGRQDLDQLQTRKMKGLKRKGIADDYDLALSTNGVEEEEESEIKRARRADSV